jgi:hypothetical protein
MTAAIARCLCAGLINIIMIEASHVIAARGCAPDDRLREASIAKDWIASSLVLLAMTVEILCVSNRPVSAIRHHGRTGDII